MAFSLRYSAVSDIGRTRKKNDDSGYAGPHFVMVADGMGGAAAGDLASAVAVQTMQRLDTPQPEGMVEALAGAVNRANDRLAELIDEDAAVDGMGTTVTAALFDGERIAVAHLGDSRGYMWRDGELLRITNDHTWVQSLIDEGRLSEDEAKVHSHRSLLLKVLDGRHDNAPDLAVYDVQPGDRILICSDGLSGFVDHERMQRVLSIGTADSVSQELVQLALEAGSTDNITVIVADVVDESEPDAAQPLIVGSAAEEPRGTLSRLRTWTGREDVTPGETLVDPDIDPEELRYAPRAPRRFRWLVRGLVLVIGLALVTVGAVLSYNWSQSRYYVAAYDGKVAIYKGVQADLPWLTMHHVYETENLLLTQLPTFRRSQVLDGLPAHDLDHAHSIVATLTTFAAVCSAQASRSSVAATQTTAAVPPGPTGRRSQPQPTQTITRTIPRPPHRTTHSAPSTTARQTTHSAPSTTAHRTTHSPPPTTAHRTTGRPQSTTTPSSANSDNNAPAECSGATPLPGPPS